MTYIKINDTLYPAEISGRARDSEWAERSTKTIKLTMTISEALNLFVNDIQWFIVDEYMEGEKSIQVEYDNSEYCLAGDIIDHRNGKISVKMGKITDKELLEIMTGGNQE